MLRVRNEHLIPRISQDYWYHLGFGPSDEVKAMFHDVKFVCMGGKGKRMEDYAKYLHQELNAPANSVYEEGTTNLRNLAASAGRYCMYKVGNTLSVSHGMGMPTFQILLNELFKLLAFSECKDVSFIRIGTSGGLGVEPGTTVVSKQGYSSMLKPYFTQVSCGKETEYDSDCDAQLREKLMECGRRLGTKIVVGNTMACNGFYEEQGRLDGAMCTFSEKDKMAFLKKAHDECGIVNIEMETNMFAAMCKRFGVKGATVCVCLLDRMKGDIVDIPAEDYKRWEKQPQEVVAELIKSST